jgi:hypothetical protein
MNNFIKSLNVSKRLKNSLHKYSIYYRTEIISFDCLKKIKLAAFLRIKDTGNQTAFELVDHIFKYFAEEKNILVGSEITKKKYFRFCI